jgi:hypothetical protein
MNTFKRKALFAAVLAGLGMGIAYATPPPNMQPTTVYPYYTFDASSSSTLVHEYVTVVARSGHAAHVGLGLRSATGWESALGGLAGQRARL